MKRQYEKICVIFIIDTLVVVSFVSSLAGCLQDVRETDRSNMTIGQTHLPSSNRDDVAVDDYEFADEHLAKLISETLPKIGLGSISDSRNYADFELRLWLGLGARTDPMLLGFRTVDSKHSALVLLLEKRSDSLRLKNIVRAKPRSEWSDFIAEARFRLDAPNLPTRDPIFTLDRDEPLIVLEVFEDGTYHRVLYRYKTSSDDAKRVVALCEFIAYEFGLKAPCQFPAND